MIRKLKKNLSSNGNVDLIRGDAEVIADECSLRYEKFDLIISNATVQWFNTPQKTLKYYKSILSDTGILVFSTFGPDTFYELRESFYIAEKRLNLPHKDHVLSFMSAQDWKKLTGGNRERHFCIERRPSFRNI